ncbi:pyruvate dehydrogenase (acetyl-transferring) E1 component subunit alpha [Pelagibius litoralis]|uniref:Pyruvate dehydrogenase E1 component subunit alpha n=1 Tax=Pelagibius litoralis TaxID=374515 RepID=A0A967C8P0_9PROT|nr:pyruvate dehydrogenase (acetyl-transferring) E1 component subunit alpha [Pelagibius litoralis]NIA68542.1 pyruvate dehydrogenase (acetyl-transferring) E1 component subunit alpha [Pelagibius litoralis]
MSKPHLSREHALHLLREMLRIRRFEEKCAELYTQEKIRGFLHLYIGEEANAVGVMQALAPDDAVVATYREHGHALARGVSMDGVMAEMYGKQEGCSGGRGGSMHIFDAATNFYGGNAIVGGGLPLAVGLALADKLQGRDRVTACFFGEGAVAEGEFHESLNLAALWNLPVFFVCENNLYAMGTALEISESETDIHKKAESYRIASEVVDGMDVVAVEAAAQAAVEAIRTEGKPRFLECRTYRFRAHSMFDAQLYREKGEVEKWKEHGPILRYQTWLRETGILHGSDVEAMEAEVAAEVQVAVDFAEQGTWEPVENLLADTYADGAADTAVKAAAAPPPEMTYREAMREALREALTRDERVFLMGEDVAHYGGCYAVSMGLLDEFGPERIRDTPLSESGFTGAGIGAALGGMRPIVEVMTVNFSLLALDQILNSAATLRHMSGGQFGVPLVIRMATGAGKQLAAQHSHSLEGWFAHIPGIKILAPATVADARAMLAPALADPDPVLIFENVMLYNRRAEADASIGLSPESVWQAALRRTGKDVTVIAYGGGLWRAMTAAEELAEAGIEAEVVDLRCLRPLDDATIAASVAKTRRAVIVDDGWRSGSLAAEISARITEECFWSLDAPVERVCGAEVPIPYPRHLEQASLPQPADIVAAAKRTLHRT